MSKRQRAAAAAPNRPAPSRAEPAPAPAGAPRAWDRIFLMLLVAIPVVLNAIWLFPELSLPVPNRNDLTLHWQMVQSASDAVANGMNPLDFWMPQVDLGYPQFLYYQNLPHLVVVALHRLLFGAVDLLTVFNGTRYLLMVGLPLTVYWSVRQMEFSVRAAAISAAAASLFAAKEGYGLEFNAHLWIGRGLFTQLWAEHLAFVALACLYRLMRTGRGYIATVAVLAALALSHFIWSYMIAIAGAILWLLVSGRGARLANVVRLGIVGALAVAIASYMLVPFAASSGKYLAVFPGVQRPDYDPLTPLRSTLNGELMDLDRLPVLTVLAGVGILAAALRRNRSALLALGGSAIWLVLYQVRPVNATFIGQLLRYDGHLIFRFIGALEMFILLLIGTGGEWLWSAIADRRLPFTPTTANDTGRAGTAAGSALAFVALLAFLSPAIKERLEFYGLNGRSMARTERALQGNTDFKAILDTIATQPGGRAYVGLATNWGEKMTMGPVIKAYDVLKFNGVPAVVPPFQALSLNSGMMWEFMDADPHQYDLLDARYVIAPAKAPPAGFFEPFMTTGLYALYRVPTTGIATYGAIVERRAITTQVELLQAMHEWWNGNRPAARQFVRWDYLEPAGALTQTARCPQGGRTLSEKVDPGAISLVVECPAMSTLVLKTTYHPNWHITVDGRPASAYMVSPSFIALDLPAGQHRVEARYEMAASKWRLLLFGMVTLALAIVFRRHLDWLPQRLLRSPASSAGRAT